MTRLVWIALIAAGACTGDDTPLSPAGEKYAYLKPTEQLVRVSMALRGIRPSLDELAAVEENPANLEPIVDFYLDQPALGETVREVNADAFLIGVDASLYPAGFPTLPPLDTMDSEALNQSIVEAPLRLIEHVVMNDRPYTEIVTADYTLADPIVSTVWGIPYPDGAEGWQETHYTDGRPHAGVLSDPFLFVRHASTPSNKSRGRANAIAKSLLCFDFLDRHVEIDTNIDLADEEAVARAIELNPACQSCHQTLDPLASYFADHFLLLVPAQIEAYPVRSWTPEFAFLIRSHTPAYYGTPSADLADLGRQIADDPRFASCTVRRFYSFLHQSALADVPIEREVELRDVFVDSDYDLKALLRAIVLSDDFRVAGALDEESGEDLHALFKASPRQIARTVEDLTGYRWRTNIPYDFGSGNIGEIDLMTDALLGFEVLAGGTDSTSVTVPSRTITATSALVQRSLAAHAAPWVVRGDLDFPDRTRRRLLDRVEYADTGEAAIRQQLVALERRMYGSVVAADSAEVDDLWTLWSSVHTAADGDTERAWTVTLYAMLQDVRLVYY
jgi:hypothetical protein